MVERLAPGGQAGLSAMIENYLDIVGGANSAGQAAMHFSRYATAVTMLVRGDSLSRSMSRYLVDQILATRNIWVRLNTRVVAVHGQDRLEAITVLDAMTGAKDTLPTTRSSSSSGPRLIPSIWKASCSATDRDSFSRELIFRLRLRADA
jgi:thioredoxin reductase